MSYICVYVVHGGVWWCMWYIEFFIVHNCVWWYRYIYCDKCGTYVCMGAMWCLMVHVVYSGVWKCMSYHIKYLHTLFIEKVHLDDLDLYVITFIALATSVLL